MARRTRAGIVACSGADIAIEGIKGLCDGYSAGAEMGSTAELTRVLNL